MNILILIRRVLFWVVTFVATVLLIALLLLQTSFFQNYVADFVLENINTKTQQTAKFTNIEIKWFDFVEIKGLEVFDYQDNLMVRAKRMAVDYELNQLFTAGNLYFDKVYILDGELNLADYEDSLAINLVEFISSIKQLTKPKEKPAKQAELGISKIRLDHFSFSYDNQQKDSLDADLFDYGHFRLDIPVASFRAFKVKSDTIQARILALTADDYQSHLKISRLKTELLVSNAGLELENLLLETPYSTIRETIKLRYSGMQDLGHFVDSVSFELDLKASRIAKRDLMLFAKMPEQDFNADITAKISGSVPHLSVKEMRLAVGGKTHLHGSIDMYGLPAVKETFVDATINDGEIQPEDIREYVGEGYKNISGFGEIYFSGRFLGFINDFVANAHFETDQGNAESDINLKFPKGWDDASYSGTLKLDNFNLGSVINDPKTVGRINFDGEIKGRGLTQKKAKFFMNAELIDSEFYGYPYQKIIAKGDFAAEFFKGELMVDDPNCDLQLSGDINMATTPELVNITSDIRIIDFKELGFMDERLKVSSRVQADIRGLSLDSLEGDIALNAVSLYWVEDSLKLDSMRLASFKQKKARSIDVEIPNLSVKMNGDFLFSTLIKDLKEISVDVKDYFSTDYEKRRALAIPNHGFDQYSIDFSVSYKNINEYLDLFVPDLYVSPNGIIEGNYYQRNNATLSLYTEVDSVNYKGIGYNENTIDINLSKDLDSLGIIASAYINSREQIWRNIETTKDLSLEGVWYDNKVDLSFNIEQPENNSSASVNAEMRLLDHQIVFNFLPSRVFALGERWYFNPFNKMNITSREIRFDRIELYHNEQSIALTGKYSDSLSTALSLKFTDFDLSILNTISPTKLAGVLNTNIDLDRSGYNDPYKLLGELSVDQFEVNEFEVGNVTGHTSWDPSLEGLSILLDVTRESVNTISVSGYYFPGDSINQLDIESDFNGAEIALAGPFFTGIFSDLSGLAEGTIRLSGTTSRPVLNGKTEINEGMFTFDYLGTTYEFNGDLEFDNKSINFSGVRLLDRDGDRASLRGKISHNGFKDFNTDLSLAASNFAFLNTTASDNSLYYGTANATGDIKVKGPFEDLLIQASVTTEKGTKIYIPLSGDTDVSQKDYISFVDLTDSTSQLDLEEFVRKSITGVRLDFEVDVTPDAYVELIFDIRTGDIIRGRGNGNLNLSLDTNGDFELFGDLTITEGAYNFTIPNFINKEFNIVPGSTISWYGDPYKGILDLRATYRQLASLNDYQPSATSADDQASQKHPFLVVLELDGEMLSPAIDFSIKMDESHANLAANQQFTLQSINNNEQELKRQVFSLLILRKFSAPQSFQVGASDVNSSVSEFLSNQFSYFISQVDENLEVDVDLSSLDSDALNTFQLRFSYTFLDGRLRVSGGGAIPQNSADDASASGFIGDWSVRYLLTPDGHLRVKAFSQSEQVAGSQQRESGVSFQYVKSFDDFKDLINKTREGTIESKPKDLSKERKANSSSGG